MPEPRPGSAPPMPSSRISRVRASSQRSASTSMTDAWACLAALVSASEAITNAAKHAQASVIDVCADARDGTLTLSVSDDGIGGADPGRGSGIIGLQDRVEALGGTITVLSPPGHGTTLRVYLPAVTSAAPTLPRTTAKPAPAWRTSRREENS